MKLYYSLLTAIAILLGSAYPAIAADSPLPSPQVTQIPQKLGVFTGISVRGPIQLVLEQTNDSQENFLQFVEGQHSPTSFSVKNDILYLQADNTTAPTLIKVGVAELHQLMVDDGASVKSSQLTSSSLSIDANTSGSIELLGMITLEQVLSSGSGAIHVQWVDSPSLRVEGSGHSLIQLAGIAGSVEMRLRDSSQFQGQYLRIDQIFVQTKDYSSAKLLVNNSLRAFAYDHSNVYYYKKPAELTEFTAGSGNILQLGWGQ